MSLVARRVEPEAWMQRFEAPTEPDIGPIMALHRGHDGYISFGRRNELGQFENLFAVEARELDQMFPYMRDHLIADSYYSINATYRPSPGRIRSERVPTLFKGNKRSRDLRWLTAVYLDIDCYNLEITVGDALGRMVDLQDAGAVPPVSMFVRSGRGLWAFWFLEDRIEPGSPQRASGVARRTYYRLQHRLHEIGSVFGSDPQARDNARITRVPGSLSRVAGRHVSYWIQGDKAGGYTYTLEHLCTHFGVAPGGALVPEPVKVIPPHVREQKQRGWKALQAKRLDAFTHLAQIRHGFDEGCRNRACLLYAMLLDKNGTQQAEIEQLVFYVGRKCRPPLSDDEITDAINSRNKIGQMIKNQTIADWLDITPAEADELGNKLPCAYRFKPKDHGEPSNVPTTRTELRQARRSALADLLHRCGDEVPTLEVCVDYLDEHGLKASQETVRKQLHALLAEAGREHPRRKRERQDPTLPLLPE